MENKELNSFVKKELLKLKKINLLKEQYNQIQKKLFLLKESEAEAKAHPRFISDKEIEDSFVDFKIREIKFNRPDKRSGYIDVEFPKGAEDKVDNFIIYGNGRIAFDYWYPENVYLKLVDAITKNRGDVVEENVVEKSDVEKKYDDSINKAYHSFKVTQGKEMEEYFSRILFDLFQSYEKKFGKKHELDDKSRYAQLTDTWKTNKV